MTRPDGDEVGWEQARLIPVSGIRGADEQERRGVSALLATLTAVREFGHAIVCPLGAPRGRVTTFIEVPFEVGDRQVRPDGVIRVTRGKVSWTALVEVKTGRNDLRANQVEDYLELARQRGFNAVLTISNQLLAAPGQHATVVDPKKLRRVSLVHLSWSQIHTEAVIERCTRSVSDPDQAWILTELIRYLEHPQSGAVDFDDMGPSWVQVRESVARRTLRSGDSDAVQVVARFAQLASFAGMKLSRRLGVSVEPALTRNELRDVAEYLHQRADDLAESGVMRASLQVPDAIAPIEILADLRAGRVSCRIRVKPPDAARNSTRVKWLVRQLVAAPDDVLLEATPLRAKGPGPSCKLSSVRQDPTCLFEPSAKELRTLTLTHSKVAGTSRGKGRASFVNSVLDLVEEFYESVVQHLKPWTAPAPPVREGHEAAEIDEDGVSGFLPGGHNYRDSLPRTNGSARAESSTTVPGFDTPQQDPPGVRVEDQSDSSQPQHPPVRGLWEVPVSPDQPANRTLAHPNSAMPGLVTSEADPVSVATDPEQPKS